MTQSRVGAPQLVCGSSAKGFHFYTLIGSQILSGCKLLWTNFSPLHTKVPSPPSPLSFFLPKLRVLFPNVGCESQKRWAWGLIVFSPKPQPKPVLPPRSAQRPPNTTRTSHATTSKLRPRRAHFGSSIILSQLLPPLVTSLLASYFFSVVSTPLSFSSFPQPGLSSLFFWRDPSLCCVFRVERCCTPSRHQQTSSEVRGTWLCPFLYLPFSAAPAAMKILPSIKLFSLRWTKTISSPDSLDPPPLLHPSTFQLSLPVTLDTALSSQTFAYFSSFVSLLCRL